MTLIDPLLLAALEDAASLTPKGPMLATLQAFDDALAGVGSGVTDGDKGDIIVSAGGATWLLKSIDLDDYELTPGATDLDTNAGTAVRQLGSRVIALEAAPAGGGLSSVTYALPTITASATVTPGMATSVADSGALALQTQEIRATSAAIELKVAPDSGAGTTFAFFVPSDSDPGFPITVVPGDLAVSLVGNFTSGSLFVIGIASTAGLVPGMTVVGTDFSGETPTVVTQANTLIASVNSGSQITLDKTATNTATAAQIDVSDTAYGLVNGSLNAAILEPGYNIVMVTGVGFDAAVDVRTPGQGFVAIPAAETDSFTVDAGHYGAWTRVNKGTALTATFSAATRPGGFGSFRNVGAGVLTLAAAAGVTVTPPPGKTATVAQGGIVSWVYETEVLVAVFGGLEDTP